MSMYIQWEMGAHIFTPDFPEPVRMGCFSRFGAWGILRELAIPRRSIFLICLCIYPLWNTILLGSSPFFLLERFSVFSIHSFFPALLECLISYHYPSLKGELLLVTDGLYV